MKMDVIEEDIANVKLEDDGGSGGTATTAASRRTRPGRTKRFVRAPPFGAHSIERNVEARRVGRAKSSVRAPQP